MTEHFFEPAQAYETVSGRILLRTMHNVRDRARDLVERRPRGAHAATRKPRDLRTQAKDWIHEHDTPANRTGALGVAAAVVIAGLVGGAAGSAEPELQLERQAVVASLSAEAAAATPAAPESGGGPAAPAAQAGPAGGGTEAVSVPVPQGPVAPLDDAPVTSPFGYRENPLAPGALEFHTGTDFGAGTGTPVKASAAGTVVEAGWHTTGGGGLRIVIDHGDGLQTTYNHLNSIDVEVGQTVEAGQVIAGVGSTGNSTGPHLHFEVLRHGAYEDPMGWL
ncbi:M23 family metallopeptidase [Arthrobacter sp. zg-Y750]|uniref:M23 family metallopeptidase n=1 Tax=Arthrobacter sp. zg-Y750 TaxID=2894189 RepID=UPI001E37509B|nr:M23 family metallopeptidase [Arthrobacter sp. zg-Y750]MCC9176629.1 M23 family metallopeptidase [Arthrobacter sp. zg-Y750]